VTKTQSKYIAMRFEILLDIVPPSHHKIIGWY